MNVLVSFRHGALVAALLSPATSAAAGTFDCRANGAMIPQGEVACLHLPSGDQLARCEKVLNNPSWVKTGDGCPVENQGTGATPAQAPGSTGQTGKEPAPK